MINKSRFSNLTYDDFRALARENGLSKYERIGFPDTYREGIEPVIFSDIRRKLIALDGKPSRVADIGPGCSDLPLMLIELCGRLGHHLSLLDSSEMLSNLPDAPFIEKCITRFPDCVNWIRENEGRVDSVLCYSVLHYVLNDGQIFGFLDSALSLLAPGGRLLIGDIPNISYRKRFFASQAGIDYHKSFMKTEKPPQVDFNQIESNQIDDAILFSLVHRARAQGFNAYVVPQESDLPMSNRREDILIIRP